MSKQKLPKNWIVVNSKTHPDQVYYFNVKTNQSTWDDPFDNKSAQVPPKPGERSGKHKRGTSECESVEHRPTTPERDIPKQPNVKRKKLVAKRLLQRPEDKGNDVNETPQMRILREKILKKKEKSNISKNDISKDDISKNNVSIKPKDVDESTSSSKPIKKSKSLACTSEKDTTTKMQNLTPQMQAIYERMEQRALKAHASRVKKSLNNKNVKIGETTKTNKEQPMKLRRPRSQYISTSSSNNLDTSHSPTTKQSENNVTVVTPLVKDEQDKVDMASSAKKVVRRSDGNETEMVKRGQKLFKKNLGKERMDTLRKSLNLEKEKHDSDCASNASSNKSSCSICEIEAIPDIRKTAKVRLVRLSNRLSQSTSTVNKSTNNDLSEKSPPQTSSKIITTVDDLVERSNETSFYEEMDWEPMEDEKITFEVQEVRNQLCTQNDADITSNVPTITLGKPLPLVQQQKQQLYIVIDTNVFLSNIEAVDSARDLILRTYDLPMIVIPWTVIRELDYIKDNRAKTKSPALCAKARKAVNYLNKLFSSKHPRVIGQTPEDVEKNKEKFRIDCPDDEILQTCLQIRDYGKSVVLMSYDKNLCTKAMIYDIVTLGRNDPLEKVDFLNASSDRSQLLRAIDGQDNNKQLPSLEIRESCISKDILEEAMNVIREFLTVIVSKEMREIYGDFWENYVLIRPPWTALTVLQCAIKHWIAAVSESFARKADVILKDLFQVLKSFPDVGATTKETGYILDKCSDLIQMVNINKHSDLMIQASQKIDNLKNKCHEYEVQVNEEKLRNAIGFEDNVLEQRRRADKAFHYFEAAYVFARDMCGLAAELVGMSCSFHHKIPNPRPSSNYVKLIQPQLSANVSRLLHTLTSVMEQADNSCVDHRTLIDLYQILVEFLPESVPSSLMCNNEALVPLDVYCCVKEKEDVLKSGLRQLHELNTHFRRLANVKST